MPDFTLHGNHDPCPHCDNGLIFYDENHARHCKMCCPHAEAYRQSEGQPNPGQLTCTKCGKEME